MTKAQINAVVDYLEDGFSEPAAVEYQPGETPPDAQFTATLLNRSYRLKITQGFLEKFSVPEAIVAQLRELNLAKRMDRGESGKTTVLGATAESSQFQSPEDYQTTPQPACPGNPEHRGIASVSDRPEYNRECKACGSRFLLL